MSNNRQASLPAVEFFSMERFYDLGDRLRKLRKSRGLTQEQLGRAAQVSPSKISGYENEKVVPELKTLRRLLDALDETPEGFWAASGTSQHRSSSGRLLELEKKLEALNERVSRLAAEVFGSKVERAAEAAKRREEAGGAKRRRSAR